MTNYGIIPQEETDTDIKYLKDKLSYTSDEKERNKLLKQIELLEDAVVRYRISRGEASLES